MFYLMKRRKTSLLLMKTRRVAGVTGQEGGNAVCSNPQAKETNLDENKTEDCNNSEKTEISSFPLEYDGGGGSEAAESGGENLKDSNENSDNLEGMLDRISHDLDYLLNRKPDFVGRKASKPPCNSIGNKIAEEDEAEVEPEFPKY